MSRKLSTAIKDSAIPGKYKRVLEAYAAFANNDGTNIYPSQEKLGKKAGTSADTVQRITPNLIESGILKRSEAHVCRVEACSKGSWHFSGQWGRSSKVFEIHIGNLQNAVSYLTAKCGLVNAAKCRKVKAANCGTTQALRDSAPAAPTLGKEPDSSASSPSGSEKASKPVTLAPEALATEEPTPASPESQNRAGLGALANQDQNPSGPQTADELVTAYADIPEKHLMFIVTPNVTDAMVKEQFGYCSQILQHFTLYVGDDPNLQLKAAEMVLKYNRTHRSGKYANKEDKKLYIRTAAQFLKALESPSATLMNDYDCHDHEQCEACQKAKNATHFNKFIDAMEAEHEKEAERQRAEAAYLAAEAQRKPAQKDEAERRAATKRAADEAELQRQAEEAKRKAEEVCPFCGKIGGEHTNKCMEFRKKYMRQAVTA